MLNKFLKVIIILLTIIGVGYGIKFTINNKFPNLFQKKSEINIYSMMQSTAVDVTDFYTYGKSFGLNGKMENVSKDNIESVKLYVTDGKYYEATYNLDYSFDGTTLNFSTQVINDTIVIDNLENGDYYIFLRLKSNNFVDAKYYSFKNNTEYEEFNYYTVTKNMQNRMASIKFDTVKYEKNEYNVLKISIEDATLTTDVYDIVIDAGHGGKDAGEYVGTITEADIALEYAESLKTYLEEAGYKVKLTRDETNSSQYTATNMYDLNGRITTACKTRAKLMISFHMSNDQTGLLSGFEIYAPCKSNLDFAKNLANNINNNTAFFYSNNNSSKQADGVYVKNFDQSLIKSFNNNAEKNGYEPYNITENTPYLYTIREVGGIATGAFVDGRNTAYSRNMYYNSNQGIECYQIELGYIKNNLDLIRSNVQEVTKEISNTIENNY